MTTSRDSVVNAIYNMHPPCIKYTYINSLCNIDLAIIENFN